MRYRDLVIVAWLLMFVLYAQKFYYEYRSIALSKATAEIERKIEDLRLDNQLLEVDLYTRTSLTNIREKAMREGWKDLTRDNVIYLTN